jgi:hypothetical protein
VKLTLLLALALPLLAQPPTGYNPVPCAPEGGTCTFAGTLDVKFGANGKYFDKTLASPVPCFSYEFGGDPIFGTVKACYLPTVAPPLPPLPPIPDTFISSDGSIMILQAGANFDLSVDPEGAATPTGNSDLSGANKLNLGATGYLSITVPNESTTGTIQNRLAAGFAGKWQAIIFGASTGPAIGIVVSGAGTDGNARIARYGFPSCDFDGPTTAWDYVQPGLGGLCHDAGAVRPTSGQVLGYALSSNAVAGTYTMLLGE